MRRTRNKLRRMNRIKGNSNSKTVYAPSLSHAFNVYICIYKTTILWWWWWYKKHKHHSTESQNQQTHPHPYRHTCALSINCHMCMHIAYAFEGNFFKWNNDTLEASTTTILNNTINTEKYSNSNEQTNNNNSNNNNK